MLTKISGALDLDEGIGLVHNQVDGVYPPYQLVLQVLLQDYLQEFLLLDAVLGYNRDPTRLLLGSLSYIEVKD